MSLRAVAFDCAGTLVRVRWQPGRFAVDCLRATGWQADEQVARERYERLLAGRWTEYRQVNATRDHEACRAFWAELTRDWLEAIEAPLESLGDVLALADDRLYGPGSSEFEVFDDSIVVLAELKQRGLKLAVISNWDYSLHRVLASLSLSGFFDVVIASLEEGVEKPDPALFRLALERLGVSAEEALHVGDDPLDDVEGARRVGMKALLLDRELSAKSEGVLTSLKDLLEVAQCIA